MLNRSNLPEMDLYAALGVTQKASAAEVKQAYRQKLLQEHPDKGGHKATFQRVKAAFDVLGDSDRRALYDKCGMAPESDKENVFGFGGITPRGPGRTGSGPSYVTPSRRSRGLSDPNASIKRSGAGAGGATPLRKGRGRDARFPLKVSLEDLYTGKLKKLRVNRTIICGHCHGSGAEESRTASHDKRQKFEARTLCKICTGSGVRQFEQASQMKGRGTTYQQMQTVCNRCKGLGVCIPVRGNIICHARNNMWVSLSHAWL